MSSAVSTLAQKLRQEPKVKRPHRATFEEFLREDAMVPAGAGVYAKFSFEGREVLLAIVRQIDRVLGADGGKPLNDSLVGVAGGAQFGKTVLEMLLAAYCTGQRFLNFGLYLPDDDIAGRVIDTKFRPDVLDQIGWLAEMTQVGRAVNKSGKSVNTKKAATVSDGVRRCNFLVSGLQKPATTFTLDVTARDEEDDIPPKNAKFVKGRMTSSKYRIQFVIGTQRVHGRGQNKLWRDGSQAVVFLGPQSDAWQYEPGDELKEPPAGYVNPEEAFPGIVRHAVTGIPRADDPKLTWAGDFRHDEAPMDTVSTHRPENFYYLASPISGEPLDRLRPVVVHRRPERLIMRNWTIRISQLGIGAIGLSQIVGQFTLAVEDPDEMIVFRCDVLGLPKSMAQALTPEVIQRAQGIDPYDLRMVREPGRAAFAGLDIGDKCWLTIREVESSDRRRLIYAASIPVGDVVRRVASLHAANLFDCLFADQRPEASAMRELMLMLNGLENIEQWPAVPKVGNRDAYIVLPGGLKWDGSQGRWSGLRGAVVRFDHKRPGQGITHDFDAFEQDGAAKFVPLIKCNRQETIERVVRELLTPDEGVNEVLGGLVRVLPSMLLPVSGQPIIERVSEHFIAGSEREIDKDGSSGDYVDGIQNHLLFANGYAALAETVCEIRRGAGAVGEPVAMAKHSRADRVRLAKDVGVML